MSRSMKSGSRGKGTVEIGSGGDSGCSDLLV